MVMVILQNLSILEVPSTQVADDLGAALLIVDGELRIDKMSCKISLFYGEHIQHWLLKDLK